MDQKALIWAGCGLASGFALGYAIRCFYPTHWSCNNKSEKALHSKKASDNREKNVEQKTFSVEKVNESIKETAATASPKTSLEIVIKKVPTYTAKENFPDLKNNKSYMARFITEDIYVDVYNQRTPLGFTIDQVIQPGLDNPDAIGCGIVAGDEYCYDLYSGIFDPVIRQRHREFTRTYGVRCKPSRSLSEEASPFDSKYVKSSYFLIGRCLQGFRFSPSCSRAERNEIERLLKAALLSLKGSNAGTYVHMSEMTTDNIASFPELLQSLSKKAINRTLSSGGSLRDWPSGRGVFFSATLNLFAWVNFEDHLRVMLFSEDSNFINSYKKFQCAIIELEAYLFEFHHSFAIHCDYGYLLPCPSGIGTALRAAVSIKLPRAIRHPKFNEITKNLRLHLGASDKDALQNGLIDVYNKDRLGFTEAELLHQVADAVHKLCEIESKLEADRSFSDVLSYKSIFEE